MCVSQVTFKLYDFQAVRLYALLDGAFGRSRVRGASRGLCFCGRPRVQCILYIGDRLTERETALVWVVN